MAGIVRIRDVSSMCTVDASAVGIVSLQALRCREVLEVDGAGADARLMTVSLPPGPLKSQQTRHLELSVP